MFSVSDWSGGIYATPGLQGSRNGAISVGSWAALLHIGRDGFSKSAKNILDA